MDLAKLDAAIAYIEAHPTEHDQSSYFARWDCRTTACIAGTVAVLAGWSPVWHDDAAEFADRVARAGETGWVFDVARDELGLTDKQAGALFCDAWDIDGIKRFRDDIAAGEL